MDNYHKAIHRMSDKRLQYLLTLEIRLMAGMHERLQVLLKKWKDVAVDEQLMEDIRMQNYTLHGSCENLQAFITEWNSRQQKTAA